MLQYLKTIILCCFICASHFSNAQNANLLIGTYTQNGSKGIYVYHFDTVNGKAFQLSHTNMVSNPSYLAISKDKQNVYSVNEDKEGGVSFFILKNNALKLIQQTSSNGAHPCYLCISPDEKNIFVANYNGGSIAQFYRFADGRISNARQIIQHQGSSIHKERQEKAHVHGTFFSPDGKFLFTPDLGMDQVNIYPYKSNANPVLQTDKNLLLPSTPGAGPRHIAFSSTGHLVYVAEELSGTVTVFQFNKGIVKKMQTIPSHPNSFTEQAATADIHLSPDGKYVYLSNRGTENNIVKYEVIENGLLNIKNMTYFSTKGIKPRNFTISNDGKWLLVANQDSDNVVVFKLDKRNGDLIYTGNQIKVSMPVCLILF